MTESTTHAAQHQQEHEAHNDIVYPEVLPFVLMHVAALGVFWSGFTVTSIVLCVTFYLVRMWAITAGFHRYFSHRSYKTSRWFQFVLAFLGQMSAQRGVLWWAVLHRHHHRHSDTPEDVHSPVHTGFWHSHFGWLFNPEKNQADYSGIQDFYRYPELRWLNRHQHFPALLLAIFCLAVGGWPGLFVGFFLSTIFTYHATFAINSVAHVVGKKRYLTADESRNNWWLAVLTLGEGWHNNHHYYQSSTRQGFFWWEIDLSYYVLKMLSWTGVVWDLRTPPRAVLAGEQHPGKKVVERVAREVAESLPLDRIADQVREAWANKPALPSMEELRLQAEKSRADAVQLLHDLNLPHVPSVDDLRHAIAERYAESPSLDEIAERSREIILEHLSQALKLVPPPRRA
ncbi:MAG: fatty acid desaturase [Gemmatimonadota bacterium]